MDGLLPVIGRETSVDNYEFVIAIVMTIRRKVETVSLNLFKNLIYENVSNPTD